MEEKKENEQVPLNKLEELLGKIVRVGHGPKANFVLEWNRQTMGLFDRGNKPKIGNKYCFKCVRFDGKHGYFVLEHI
jgi:hypothetical protein